MQVRRSTIASARQAVAPEERRPGRAMIVLLATAVLALAAAVGAGWWIGGTASDPPAVAEPATAMVGPVAFEVDPSWERLPDDPGASGLAPARTAVFALQHGSSARATVTIAPAEHRSLIPRAVRARLTGALPAPAPGTHLGHDAWVYAELPTVDGRLLEITLVPTTLGVLAIVCSATRDDVTAAAGCASAMSALDLGAASALRPQAALALRAQLQPTLARLNARRVDLRAALRRARTPAGQARVARRLAGVHARARSSLAGAPGAVPAQLGRVAEAYRRLGGAAARGRPGAFRRGRHAVTRAERRLDRMLARVR